MKEIQSVFYGISIFFFMVLIGFFVGSYLNEVSSSVKVVLSFLVSIILFFIGDELFKRGI